MALWIVLVATVVASLPSLSIQLTPQTKKLAAEQWKGASWWRRLALSQLALSAIVTAGWVWHGLGVGDWRFVAIGVAPLATVLATTVLREMHLHAVRREVDDALAGRTAR